MTVSLGNPATLTVQVAPTITTQPEGKALVAGGGATLSVGVAGTPVLLYQWKKDGAPIFNAVDAGGRDAVAHAGQRLPGAVSRWSAGKTLEWRPLRPELVVEVGYDATDDLAAFAFGLVPPRLILPADPVEGDRWSETVEMTSPTNARSLLWLLNTIADSSCKSRTRC